MTAPLLTVLVSGGVVIVLILLFRYERQRGVRFFHRLRTAFDHLLTDIRQQTKQSYQDITSRTIRQSAHYIFHRVLTMVLRQIQRLEDFVRSIARSNKSRANRRKGTGGSAHFSAIAEHKRNTKLSAVEMQQRRDEALMGR